MARARLARGDRGVGHQLDIRPGELADLRVDDDRAVHLRELVEELRAEGRVEPDPPGVEEREPGRVAYDDQRALVRTDHVVDRGAQVGAGGDPGDRLGEPRVAARIVLGGRAGEAERGGNPLLPPTLLRVGLHRVRS